MRSFFKKPDWAKTDSNPGHSAEFYRRSEQVYPDIISKKIEEDETESESESEKEEKHDLWDDRLQEETQSQSQSEPRDSKRRRISREERVPSELGQGQKDDDKETIQPAAISHTQRNSPPGKVNNEHPPAALIELGSDSDEGSLHPKSQPVARPPQLESRRLPTHDLPDDAADDDEDDDDDLYEEEEYAELARKARERERQRLAASTAGLSGTDTNPAAGARTSQSPNYNPTTKSTSYAPDKQNQPIEPIVKILITSDLPNTNPLIVQRRLNQDLRDVRRAWCGRQGFSDDMTASVFLTWKGRRLFDVTTCKSLGVQEEKEKGLLLPLPIRDYYDDDEDDDSGHDDGSIEVHMEAVTEKLYEEKRRQASSASQVQFGRAGAVGDGDEDEDDDEDEKALADAKAKASQEVLLLTLKAPGIEDLKIRVRPKTHISSIIRSFREKRGIPTHLTVQLLFDGDQLHPDSMVGDNDMADLDAIDTCKAAPSSFPLHFSDAELEQEETEFQADFLRNILPRIDWEALVVTAGEFETSTERAREAGHRGAMARCEHGDD
ncbi:hypothetical protein ACJ72_08182 [Emergomyces africanus]|uniref:Rad60/SUMO-like domain-containing protein n=1 Tax=Emergomyces africanus TaxID=1955775 RepID=A0A1B7NL06_9EURO|nr:hypothetical protein ACJ72_08182 [Emergomyces africanus]